MEKNLIYLIKRSKPREFITILGCIDFNISSAEELVNLIVEKLNEITFDLYDSKLGDNLKRLSASSDYIQSISAFTVYVLWIIGNYSDAEKIGNICIKKNGNLDQLLARNLIFLYMTTCCYDKAIKMASFFPQFSTLINSIVKIQSGELASVKFRGYDSTAYFYLSCFSTQALESAITHANGRFCEEEELEAMAGFASGKKILELGSLVGNHSVFFSKFCNCSYLKCVDWNPKSCFITKLNLLNNGIDKDRFDVINAKAGKESINKKDNEFSSNGIFILDESINEIYDFIKIDIDGGERCFFDSSYIYLRKHAPIIFAEVKGANTEHIYKNLSAIGYTYDILTKRSNGEVNVLFKPS